ncbi:uncharacterized protein LOC114367746 [Glycine soja]|uniref:uncharacterized protein LOC114367746 n=1 Tax=Glycine soja TaxID=3848 RepID=UPI00103A01FD|nr:uncharacterized protein LOC114367746 [Glycine soja]
MRALLKEQRVWAPIASASVKKEVASESKRKGLYVKIEDEDAAMILLASPPPSYVSFVNSLSVGKECVTMEEVKSSLYSRELRSKAPGNSEESNGSSLVVSNSNKNIKKKVFEGKKKTHVNPKDICNYCKEPVADHHQHSENQWILNSGCSFHMCPNKTWFDTYEEKSGGNVFMGNDVSCKTIGIGTVKIKMHDGIIRTLTEVRHVPELKKNLISIGIMDGKGFK